VSTGRTITVSAHTDAHEEGAHMEPDESGTEWPPAFAVAGTWETTLIVGIVTLILGLIVAFHPSGSLNVIAV
jgi:hypothetical protein